MNRSYLGRLTAANSERVLLALTHQQHLYPARSVADAVQRVCEGQGFAATAGEQAIEDTALAGNVRIGRLLRAQVRDLAEKLELAWQAELATHVHVHGAP